MKLLGSTKTKITKDKNGGNMPHLEITEVLIHSDIINNDYQDGSRVLYNLVPNKLSGQSLDISPKTNFFKKLSIQNFNILKYGLLIKVLKYQS